MYRAHISQKDGPERTQEIREKLVTLGRADEGNGIVLPRGNVSKSHATLEFHGDSWLLSDLASTNGTYLNGKRIGQPSTVWPGDRVHIGDFMMRFELVASAPESLVDSVDVETEFDDNPTAFRADGLASMAVSAFKAGATHPAAARPTEPGPVSGRPAASQDEPPTAGLRRDMGQLLVGADTRKASLKLSLVALIERYLQSAEARRLVARPTGDANALSALRAGLEQSFAELRASGEIAGSVEREETISLAVAELSGLGPLAFLVDRGDWSYAGANGEGEFSLGLVAGGRGSALGFTTRASFALGLERLRRLCEGVQRGAGGAWSGVRGRIAVRVEHRVSGLSLRLERHPGDLLTLEAMVLRQILSEDSLGTARELVSASENVLLVGEGPAAIHVAQGALRGLNASVEGALVTQNAALAAAARDVVRVLSGVGRRSFASAGATVLDRPGPRELKWFLEAALLGARGFTVVLQGADAREALEHAALALSLDGACHTDTWREALRLSFDRYVTLRGDTLSVAGAL